MELKRAITLFLPIISSLGFAQIDTINYGLHNLADVQITAIKTKTKSKVYRKKSKAITPAQINQQPKTIDDCKPCWLRYYGKDGKLLQEGLSYSDCALGKRTEYYSSGKIKIIRYFKTNDTNNWINFPCSVAEGTWIYYKEDATIEKTEIYKNGQLIK